MKEYKFEPSKFDEGPIEGFDGHIILRPPTFDERMGYMEDCGVSVNSKGEMEMGENALKQVRKMVALSKPHYKEVKLKNLKTGAKYASYDDLSFDPDCDGILSLVGSLVLRGFRPSKNLRASSASK